ncbi:MAG: polyprenyl synthetase family protein [Pseudomonadota bacterium]
MTSSAFADARAQLVPLIEQDLEGLVSATDTAAPRLAQAMRYALMAGGKRVRPLLTVLTGALFEVAERPAIRIGAAIECIHTYSLIHDDLPAMDDALERRGRPTLHKAFDEATAILAGDALQALAFETLASPALAVAPAAKVELVRGLARAAGLPGMCGGQMLDLEAGGTSTLADVRRLQALKTGALIAYACDAGAIAAAASADDRAAVVDYGRAIGAAFQIRDDLLDVTGDAALVGKDLGRDVLQEKATFVSCLGVEGANAALADEVQRAETALRRFGAAARPLVELARYIAARTS